MHAVWGHCMTIIAALIIVVTLCSNFKTLGSMFTNVFWLGNLSEACSPYTKNENPASQCKLALFVLSYQIFDWALSETSKWELLFKVF